MPDRSLGDPGTESGLAIFISVPSKKPGSSSPSNESGYAAISNQYHVDNTSSVNAYLV